MAVTQAQLEQLYLAYFGRPADFQGVVYYTSIPTATMADVAVAFSTSAESQALYGSTVSPAMINAIYNNLFNRDAEPAGLAYWYGVVSSGQLTAAGAALAILNGAQNADAVAIQNKLAAATAFTAALDTTTEILGYSGQDAAALARTQLHTVTSDPATLTAYLANITTEVNEVVAVGGTIGVSDTLTKNVDSISFTGNTTTIDTVHGVVDGANSTLSVGDTITGNGKTIVDLAVASSGTSDFTTLKNINKVNITAATSSWVDLNAAGWSGIGSVNLTSGVGGLNVYLTALNKGAGLSIANVTGTLSTTYTNHIWTEIGATGGTGSSVSYVGGVVTGTIGTGASEVWFSSSATSDNVSQTIGNITISPATGGSATWAWASISNDQSLGGDITVGNVAISGAKYNYLSITSTGHTASSSAVNTTVGNVTITGAVAGGYAYVSIEQTSSGPVGSIKAGDITLTDNAKTASATLTVENYSYGGKTAGDITLGNVAITANGKSGSLDMSVSNYASAAGTKAATVGNLTVGNVTLSATGLFGQVNDASITNYAYDSGSGKATNGNVTIGTVAMSIGQSGTGTFSVSNYAYSSSGAATIGNLTIGTTTVNLAVDASGYISYEATAYANGKAGTVGNVTVGAMTENVGIGASMTYYMYADAYGTSASSIGTVSVGAITANIDDGGYGYNYMYEYSAGTTGATTFGDQTATLGVSGTNYFYNYVYGYAGTGAITVGNITEDASKLSGYAYDYNYFSATSGALGNVSVGNVTLNAGKSATASAYVYAYGETGVGTVTTGNVTTSAVGASAYGYFDLYVYNTGTGTVGAVTVGNVSLTANGAGASNYFYATESGGASATGGTMTIGNVNITVGNTAKATGALVSFSVDNALGAVKVGDITIAASSARTASDTTMAYDENINITAATSVTIGNIKVTGSSGGGANNFATFTNLMTVTAGTTKTIASVDYSGFTSAATIDVSAYKGAAFIAGGTKADVITDNTTQNTITGGTGGDTFTFVTGNKATTSTSTAMDVVTDFNNAQGDKISVVGGFSAALDPNTNYAEGTFTDLTTFGTAANAGNKEVYVGQIGGDSYLALDYNNDGTVDFYVKLTGVALSGIDVSSFV
jgi:hypothetical protein